MADLTRIFGGPFSLPPPTPLLPPEEQLRRAIAAAGLTPPNEIVFDGRIHRFDPGTKEGKRGRDLAGWYVAYHGDVPAGAFGCWRTGIVQTWRADVGRRLSEEELAAYRRRLEALRQEHKEALQRQYEAVAKEVVRIWAQSPPAEPDHPYLRRKGIRPNSARVDQNGRLIVPLFAPSGALSSLQYIKCDGTKTYHPGSRVSGCYWMVDFWMPDFMHKPVTIYVAEGFATAATVYEATGKPCVVAYSASNLVPVMGALRAQYGAAQDIVIVADNDPSGVGQRYAEQAVARHGGRYVMPPVEGDANDYALAGGNLIELLTNN